MICTDSWEKRKLGNILKDSGTGRSNFTLQGYSADFPYPVLGSTAIIGYDSEYDHEGNFVLTARVGANAGKLYRYSGKSKITDNTVYLKSDHPVFLEALLNHTDLKRLSFGTGQPLIKASELKKVPVFVPSKAHELEQVELMFENLENIIALHHQRCFSDQGSIHENTTLCKRHDPKIDRNRGVFHGFCSISVTV
jgi:type I restriction enzyme S subunit